MQVLITTSHAALIEVITDAPSIHALKSRLPRGSSLRDYFKQQYGTLAALGSVASILTLFVRRVQVEIRKRIALRSATLWKAWPAIRS